METKEFEKLRRQMGSILGQAVPKGSLEHIAHEVDRSGRLGNRQIISILIAMYTYLEEKDNGGTNTTQNVPQGTNIQPHNE